MLAQEQGELMPGCHEYQLYTQSVRRRCFGRARLSLFSQTLLIWEESWHRETNTTHTQLITKYWNYTSSSFSLTRFSSSWDEERESGSEIWVCGILQRSVYPAPRYRWTASPLIIHLVMYSTVVGGKKTGETCRYITTTTCFVMNMLARISSVRVLYIDV